MVIFPVASYAKFPPGNGSRPQPLRSGTVRSLEPWKGYCWWKHMRQLGWLKLPVRKGRSSQWGKVPTLQGTITYPPLIIKACLKMMIFRISRLVGYVSSLEGSPFFWKYCWWKKEIPRPTTWDAGDLIFCRVLYIPSGCLGISEPSAVSYMVGSPLCSNKWSYGPVLGTLINIAF